MMWRGTLYSTLLHGGVALAIVAGIPALPSIFDRNPEIEADGGRQSISIEIVSADSIDLRQNVVAADSPAADTKTPAVTGTLPPARLNTTAPVPPAAETSPPVPVAESRSATTRIPEGAPNRPQSVQTRRPPPSPVQRRRTTEAPRDTQAVRQPPPTAAGPEGARSTTQPREPAQKQAGETRTGKTQLPPNAEAGRAIAGSPPRVPVPAVVARSETKQAAREDTRAQSPDSRAVSGGNEFIQAVGGEKRELVRQVLDIDPRTRQTVVARAPDVKITEQARSRTLQRLLQASAKGHPHAQYNLAGKYLRGEDVNKDPAEAQELLTRAAQQGFVPAQSLLALLRYTGFGVPQDHAEAAFWWSLAADGGDDSAKVAVELLQKQLKPDELVKSKRLRARWGSLITDLAELTAGNTNRQDLDNDLRNASEEGDLDAVLSLLASGADADVAGDEGRNAVINAAWRGRGRIINLLLERGVATELPDNSGRTPLMWAAINGHIDIVRQLVEAGANPDQRDGDGGTALIRASWNGHADAVRTLIGAGADVNIKDANGMTALDHATREGNTAIAAELRAAGAR